eukprot:TRINITY_DN1039_c8_g1_i1.p1 TRINITY_DN1039_c8_g1~~TRINITY_DN1039_c8_g1_i1.p1  ORF type:complete len:491 (+),score=80.68 TRINITY_DN1039_c8_g1_i1:116-1588(+)
MAKQHSRRKGQSTGGDVWKKCLQLSKGGEKDIGEYKVLCEKLMIETPEVAIAKGAGHLMWNLLLQHENKTQVREYHRQILPKLTNPRLRSDTYIYIGKLEPTPQKAYSAFKQAHTESPLSGYPLFQLGDLCSRQDSPSYNVMEALFWFAWGASCGKLSCPHCKKSFYTTLKDASCESDQVTDSFVRVIKSIGTGKVFNDYLKWLSSKIAEGGVTSVEFVRMTVITLYALRQADTYQKNKQSSQVLSMLLSEMCNQMTSGIEGLVVGLLFLSQHKQQRESLRRFSAKSLNGASFKVLSYLLSNDDSASPDSKHAMSPEIDHYPGLLRPTTKPDGVLRTVSEARFNDLKFYHNQYYKMKKKEQSTTDREGDISVSTVSEGEARSKANAHTTTDADGDDESDCSSDSVDEVILAHPGQLLGECAPVLDEVFSQDMRCFPRPSAILESHDFEDDYHFPPPREAPSPTFEASPLREELYRSLAIPHYTLPESSRP